MQTAAPSSYDLYLYHEGSHCFSYQFLGSHPVVANGQPGVRFSVWAPNAADVSVVGNFNHWQGQDYEMLKLEASGIWQLFIPGLRAGEIYKYAIHTSDGQVLLKSDPYAFFSEQRPSTASIITDLAGYTWEDQHWQSQKQHTSNINQPMLIYEVHLGSWKRKPNGHFYSYRELADELVDYALDMGYTHLELLPLSEHPLDRSWGYQVTGYFSVTSRYGTPHDFMYFVDKCHQKGIGVIMDWVPGHFCKDEHGLRRFDGQPLYEHHKPERAEKSEWGTLAFDFLKPEVKSFLISNAIFWLQEYHIDGIRADAVASMLYLDYAKKQWLPNKYGGRENLEAIEFFKQLNTTVFKYFPHSLMAAEESTAWPLVSAPVHTGGLGFNLKWNMGWMNDVLRYMRTEPSQRKYVHNLLTFSFHYAFSENFILPFSHDEVVHGKLSLLNKLPGDYWQKFANLRLLYSYMMTHPGKKLLFMGGELGQFTEWNDEGQLDWNLTDFDLHAKTQNFMRNLNAFYTKEKAIWELDFDHEGFQWIDPHDSEQSIITFMRRSKTEQNYLVIVCNFSNLAYPKYCIGVPEAGSYREVFNSDLAEYGGADNRNPGIIRAAEYAWHNQAFSISINLPALAAVVLKYDSSRANKGE